MCVCILLRWPQVRRYAEQTMLNQAWTIMNLSDDVTVPWKQCGYYFKTARRSNEVCPASLETTP